MRSSGADAWMLLKLMCQSIKTRTVLLHKGQKKEGLLAVNSPVKCMCTIAFGSIKNVACGKILDR